LKARSGQRISAQLYNDISDYEFMARRVLSYLAKYEVERSKEVKK
jgi:hypothetical protein